MITHRFRLSGLVGAVIAWLLLLLSEFICAHLDTCSRRLIVQRRPMKGSEKTKPTMKELSLRIQGLVIHSI